MDIYCIHCIAKHFAAKKNLKRYPFHECYNHDAVYIQLLTKLPQFLYYLFDEVYVKSNNFYQHICSYNS